MNRRVNNLVEPITLAQKIVEFLLSNGWEPKSLQINLRSFQDGSEQQPAQVMAFRFESIRNLMLVSPSSTRGAIHRLGAG